MSMEVEEHDTLKVTHSRLTCLENPVLEAVAVNCLLLIVGTTEGRIWREARGEGTWVCNKYT